MNSTERLALPLPADLKKAEIYLQDFKNALAALNDDETKIFFSALETKPDIMALLVCIFGNSPYLTHSVMVDIGFFKKIICDDYRQIFNELIEKLKNYDGDLTEKKEEYYSFLRESKRRVALLIAVADITAKWHLAEVTEKLSIFAEHSVRKTCELILKKAEIQKIIKLANPEKPLENSGLIVLALGKMGAHELNYSSDIDLAVFFEEGKLEYHGRKSISEFYIGLAQELTDILSKRTPDGYVFRVDMRLRPDPASNPIAVSLAKAENYYVTVGQNWERAAFIKCNFIAGDHDSAALFLNFMESHVYRRELDFETIEDIHSIKRQIDTKQGFKENEEHNFDFYGYNVKIGRGGIREIEFYAQTQQLIWGGRRTRLKEKRTCDALIALVEEKEITKDACNELIEAYEFLRTLEHRLQMVDDAQTHTMPKTEEDMLKIAIFCGFRTIEEFFQKLGHHVDNVRKNYITLFQTSPSLASDLPSAEGSLIFTGTENNPDTIETLRRMGFTKPEFISETIRGWHHGRIAATTRKQARAELTKLIPSLLGHFALSYNPEEGFENFDDFLAHQPEDSTIFALLYQNPKLMELMAEIMSGYPEIADNLARNPSLLYYVITPEFDEKQPGIDELKQSLKSDVSRATNFEEAVDEIKEWTHDRVFRAGIKLVKQELNTDQVFVALSDIAETSISEIVELSLFMAENNLPEERKYVGDFGEFSVIAFGKLGSRELTFGSDLDLVFVYDVDEKQQENFELLGLSPQQYYTRIANRIVNCVTSFTRLGKLYNVDLRLRPNGDSGAMATSFQSFDNYYDQNMGDGKAWVWEYMALTRARAICTKGSEALCQKLERLFKEKLTFSRNEESLRKDVLYIHKKLREVKRTKDIFHVKHVEGGLVDLEYILQFLQLKFAAKIPEVLQSGLENTINMLGKHNILDKSDAETLMKALKLYQNVQNILRITSETNVSENIGRIVCKFTGFKNMDELKSNLEETQNKIKLLFQKYIGENNNGS